MMDRAKVIKGLSECLGVLANHVPECYLGHSVGACFDAIGFLMAHEPIAPTTEADENDEPYHACGGCGYMLGREMNFCPKCGRKVRWE